MIWGHSKDVIQGWHPLNLAPLVYPMEQEEAWNFKTSFKRGQWYLLVWINPGMIEKARQGLGTNRQIIRPISIRSKQKHTLYTTRRAWRHTFTKSDRRFKGLSTDVNECWPTWMPGHLADTKVLEGIGYNANGCHPKSQASTNRKKNYKNSIRKQIFPFL